MILLILWGIFAIIGASMAAKRNRSVAGWFFICLIFGIFGVILLAVLGNDNSQTGQTATPANSLETLLEKGRAQISPPAQNVDIAQQWQYLVEYDPVISQAAQQLEAHGPQALAGLREAYLSLQDRAFIPNIVAKLQQRYPLQAPQALKSPIDQLAVAPARQIPAHTTVAPAELAGARFMEAYCGVNLFELADGRIYIDRHIALPTITQARHIIDNALRRA